MKAFSQYKGTLKIFKQYWELYGGAKAVLTSPYFHLSLILTLITGVNQDWYEKTLSITPSILGFSLGGYAILLAFSNEKFLTIISKRDGISPFLSISSTFVHFIIVQVTAILFAFLYYSSPITNLPNELKVWLAYNIPYLKNIYHYMLIFTQFLGVLLFVYSLTTALAATMAIFRMSIWYNRHLSNLKNKEDTEKKH